MIFSNILSIIIEKEEGVIMFMQVQAAMVDLGHCLREGHIDLLMQTIISNMKTDVEQIKYYQENPYFRINFKHEQCVEFLEYLEYWHERMNAAAEGAKRLHNITQYKYRNITDICEEWGVVVKQYQNSVNAMKLQ